MRSAILVVEDEPITQRLIQVNLERAGHRVCSASSVAEGEARIRDMLPDLVLLDWVLPDATGVTLARKLRADQRTRGNSDHHAVVALAGMRQDHRPRDGRGRLHHQAVLAGRADRADQGGDAPALAAERRRRGRNRRPSARSGRQTGSRRRATTSTSARSNSGCCTSS
jgi:CheY-like chemotaxis protein